VSRIEYSGEWGAAQEGQPRKAWRQEPPRLDGPVRLVDYDPGWPGLYEREAGRIRSALGDRVLLLEHIGSASVPGLAAKPLKQYADAKTGVIEEILERSQEQ
jgi:hypothetical protein